MAGVKAEVERGSLEQRCATRKVCNLLWQLIFGPDHVTTLERRARRQSGGDQRRWNVIVTHAELSS